MRDARWPARAAAFEETRNGAVRGAGPVPPSSPSRTKRTGLERDEFIIPF